MGSQNGVIREYKINLTELDTGREIVLYSTMPLLTVSSLHPFYTYLCHVSAFTVEYGPFSDGFHITTPENGESIIIIIQVILAITNCLLFYIATAPSGFPQDVSVGSISSRNAELSWNPLLQEERNGVITGYVIVISRHGTESQSVLTSFNNTIGLDTLNPYTAYTVTVAATTSVGVGPPSTQLRFMTAEDGKE